VAAKERKKSEGLMRRQQQIVEVLDFSLTREVKMQAGLEERTKYKEEE
jgi:hypothetical protein